LAHAGVWGLQWQIALLKPPHTACLQCVFPEAPPPTKFPVVGATPGQAGCAQALEVLKYLTGLGTCPSGRLLMFDGLEMTSQSVRLRRAPGCPACGSF